ncbi:helix-turn-helix domain-containing protein [Thermoanaerobacterium sp. DL9XJH110]|uniref:helix-turn-helix domain-containing protein n=1 Tax=Thermoanaerobacterium sp. DL9XJH110 TaxID=3386643 RepID=UPI003BB74002
MRNYPDVMTIPQMAEFLQIGRCKAYRLAKTPGFPAVNLGKRGIRISKQALLKWMEKPLAKEIMSQPTLKLIVGGGEHNATV